MSSVSELSDYLRRVIDERYGGIAGKLAEKVGITNSVFNRGLKSGTYGLDTLFRISIETGASVSDVLRWGGKADLVELLDRIYGPPPPRPAREIEDVIEFLTRDDPSLKGIQRRAIDLVLTIRATAPEPARILLPSGEDLAGANDMPTTPPDQKKK